MVVVQIRVLVSYGYHILVGKSGGSTTREEAGRYSRIQHEDPLGDRAGRS